MTAATEFAQSLLAAARLKPIETSSFVAALLDGSAARTTVQAYARTMASLAVSFPRRLAAVLAICNDADVRQSLLANLLEEEGVVSFSPETGVVFDPDRAHGTMAKKFARAAGVKDQDIKDTPQASWFASAVERGDWLGAFTFFSVGLEANVPVTFRLLVKPLRDVYGFTEDELEFLTEHFVADERHGLEAAHLIARIATTEDARDRALTGARRGGIAWRALHRHPTTDDPHG